MNSIFTIGSNGKSAKKFFELLKYNNVDLLLDVRLNNTSQLAGITKGGLGNLDYLLKNICNIDYIHDLKLAPSKLMLDNYKNKKNMNWDTYTEMFLELYESRNLNNYIQENYLSMNKNICLLCSEEKYQECHRGIITNELNKKYKINVIHLK